MAHPAIWVPCKVLDGVDVDAAVGKPSAGATADANALTALREINEPTCADPLVEEHVHWALELHGG